MTKELQVFSKGFKGSPLEKWMRKEEWKIPVDLTAQELLRVALLKIEKMESDLRWKTQEYSIDEFNNRTYQIIGAHVLYRTLKEVCGK